MKYDDLWKYWMEEKNKQAPQGILGVVNKKNAPENYFLTPEDMMSTMNAVSPYDLYTKPDVSPKMIDYPTSAFNIHNRLGKMGIPEAIIQSSQSPQSQLSNIISTADSASTNYSNQERPYAAQGIYEHEVAHFQDPRLNPMAKNYGYMTRLGLSGNIASREIPAMRAEDVFFDSLRKQGKLGRQ